MRAKGIDNTAKRPDPLPDMHAAKRILVDDPDEDAATDKYPAIPGYNIGSILGSGGAGSVYRAAHAATGREVAVKLLSQRLGASAGAARAWRELQVLSQIRLSCLPRLLDYGEYEGRLYLVAELIDGLTLARHCDAHRLDRKARVILLADVANALHELHNFGVIHRDIKPDNIIIDKQGRPFIVDLGLASLLGDDSTRTITEHGVPIGSPAFMSPEQAQGDLQALSALSDVYSLGATAYFILTGDTPHDTHTSVHEAIRRVAQEPARDPRALSQALPRVLASVLRKCVSQKPKDRYASAQAFGEDLRRWLRGDAVEATSPNAAQHLGRFVGRHPILVVAFSLGFILTLGATAFITHLTSSLNQTEATKEAVTNAMDSMLGILRHSRYHERNSGSLVHFIDESERPSHGGRYLVLMPDPAKESRALSLLCFREDKGVADQLDPKMTVPFRSDGAYKPRKVMIVGAVAGDLIAKHPGTEVAVALIDADFEPSVIQIWDMELSGEPLMEVWSEGHVHDMYWNADQRLLAVVVTSNRLADNVAELADFHLLDQVGHRYPRVLLAFRPLRGRYAMFPLDADGPLRPLEPTFMITRLPAYEEEILSRAQVHIVSCSDSSSTAGPSLCRIGLEAVERSEEGELKGHSWAAADVGIDGKILDAFADQNGRRFMDVSCLPDPGFLRIDVAILRRAQELLDACSHDLLDLRASEQWLFNSDGVSNEVREAARAMLLQSFPGRAAQEVWPRVESAELSPEAYSESLMLATLASEMHPFDGRLLFIRGVAEFRVGDYEATVESLYESRQREGHDRPARAAVLAMALQQLGNRDEAIIEFASMRRFITAGGVFADASPSLVREAEEMLGFN